MQRRKDGCILQKHPLAVKAFYVFLDPDFPALLLINSAAFGSTENSTQNYHFAVKYPKPSDTLKDMSEGGTLFT